MHALGPILGPSSPLNRSAACETTNTATAVDLVLSLPLGTHSRLSAGPFSYLPSTSIHRMLTVELQLALRTHWAQF